MSELYESIPSERQQAYLQKAQEAINEAAEPVAMELGSMAVKEAEYITALDAKASTLGDETSDYVHENDLHKKFMAEMEGPRENGVAEQAEEFLARYGGVAEQAEEFLDRHNVETGALDIKDLIGRGNDDEIRKLTIHKNDLPDQPPEKR